MSRPAWCTSKSCDERGKMDINQVPPGLLAGLFSVLGADDSDRQRGRQRHRRLAQPVRRRRCRRATCRRNIAWKARLWGPPGQEIERLDELKLVRGMTPQLYEALVALSDTGAGTGALAAICQPGRAGGHPESQANRRPDGGRRRMCAAQSCCGSSRPHRVPATPASSASVLMRFDGTLSGPAWKYRISGVGLRVLRQRLGAFGDFYQAAWKSERKQFFFEKKNQKTFPLINQSTRPLLRRRIAE